LKNIAVWIVAIAFLNGCTTLPGHQARTLMASYEGAAKEGCRKGVAAIGQDARKYPGLGLSSMWHAFTLQRPVDLDSGNFPPLERLDLIPVEQRAAYVDCYSKTTQESRRFIAGYGKVMGYFMLSLVLVGVILVSVAAISCRTCN
jgi:hypothetical protein